VYADVYGGGVNPERTKYGTWRARWRDANGRQKAKTFKRQADAKAHLDAVLTDLRRGVLVPNADGMTVQRWSEIWLDGARNLGRGGRDTYTRDLDRHILPALGSVDLDRLTHHAVDAYLTDELQAGLAPSTVHRHYRTLHRLCRVAVDRGLLARNPCTLVEPPRIPRTEMRFLTAAQVGKLADVIGARYRAWVLVAAWGGLRWSETVGLQRRHIDGTRITVEGQLVRRADGEWERAQPKTSAGRRAVALPAFAAAELAHHLEQFIPPAVDHLVFTNGKHNPMSGSSFTGNVFKPALRRAGLDPAIRIHDLRHTAVALCIAAGAHPKAIQSRMGHASISVTLDRYGHLYGDIDEKLAVDLDRLGGRASRTH
jgi:integrase